MITMTWDIGEFKLFLPAFVFSLASPLSTNPIGTSQFPEELVSFLQTTLQPHGVLPYLLLNTAFILLIPPSRHHLSLTWTPFPSFISETTRDLPPPPADTLLLFLGILVMLLPSMRTLTVVTTTP